MIFKNFIKLKPLIIFLFIFFAFNFLVYAGEFKLIPYDGEDGDNYGYAVDIYEDYAIVGAQYDDDKGSNSGAAYIYKKNADGIWDLQIKIVPDELDANDNFGRSVSIYGDYAVIGAFNDDDKTTNAGAVYVYKNNSGTWIKDAKLIPDNGQSSDNFRYSVSIHGNYIIVGSRYFDYNSLSNSGSAYIFKKEGDKWIKKTQLNHSSLKASDYFGESVAISSNYAIIGAFSHAVSQEDQGAAYIFKRTNETWSYVDKLYNNNNPNSSDYFGYAVAITDNYAIVGERYDDDKGSNTGSAYIYKRNENTWTLQKKLYANNANTSDYFGSAVDISDDYAIVGVIYRDNAIVSDSGSIFIYQNNGTNWDLINEFFTPDNSSSNYFGCAVAISNDYIISGAYKKDSIGAAYIEGPLPYLNLPYENNYLNIDYLDKIFTIAGFIRDTQGYPIPYVKITFTNGGGTATTNSKGYYSHDLFRGYQGIASPSGNGYKYHERAKVYSFLNQNYTDQNYTAFKFTVSGYIYDELSMPLKEVTLFLSNGIKVFTNKDGFFTVDVDYLWDGKIWPEKSGYAFEPVHYEYLRIDENKTDQIFKGLETKYSISGNILDKENKPVQGVKIYFNDENSFVETDSNGNYSFKVDYLASVDITPEKAGYIFYDKKISLDNVSDDLQNQNFTAELINFIIKGKIIDKTTKTPIDKVTVTLNENNVSKEITTDSSGEYQYESNYGKAFTISVGKEGYLFDQSSKAYSSVTSNIIDEIFYGKKKQVKISGYIRDSSGNNISGVKINFKNGHGSTTSTNGYYEYLVNYGSIVDTELFKSGYKFDPETKHYDSAEYDIVQDYVAVLNADSKSILITPDIQKVSYTKGTVAFDILVNPSDLKFTIAPNENWLTAAQSLNNLIVKFEENVDIEERSAKISIYGAGIENMPKDLTIIQSGKPAPPPTCIPDWQTNSNFNPDFYKYFQNITAIILDDHDKKLESDSDMLAAFSGNELRGVAKPVETSIGKRYFLPIYSNDFEGEEITFKHFDSINCRVNQNIKYPIYFKAYNDLGNIIEPLTFIVSDYYIRLELHKYWNWISFNITNTDMNINSVLKSIGDKGLIISTKGGELPYAQYNPDDGRWYPDQYEIDNKKMYLIKMKDSAILEYSGSAIDLKSTPINLVKGWNWVSYLPSYELEINTALSTIKDNINSISSQRGFSVNHDSVLYGILSTLIPNKGYMINMNYEDILYYPETSSSFKRKKSRKSLIKSSDSNEFDSSAYEFQATITCAIILDNETIGDEGDYLSAFVNNGIRGIAKPVYTPEGVRFFLQVWSNEKLTKEIIRFKYFKALENKLFEPGYEIEFSPNMAIGDINNPYEIKLGDITPPGWDFNASEFEFFGNIIASVSHGNDYTINNEDMLGVFVGGDCRGYVTPSETSQGKRFFLQAWSNTENEEMSYKYYSFADNKEYDLDSSFTFNNKMEKGCIDEPENLAINTYSCTEKDELITSLNTEIKSLNTSINEKKGEISDLNTRINSLNNTISNMYTEEERDQAVAQAVKEAENKCIETYSSYSLNLNPGWFLISGITGKDSIPISDPEDAIEIIYQFKDGKYSKVTMFKSGMGYWIKIKKSCKLDVKAILE